MVTCPHCNKPGISKLRKAILSPGLTASCAQCGEIADITYTPWLKAMIPGSILMLIALFIDTEWLEYALNIIGFALMIIIPYFAVPLEKEATAEAKKSKS